MKILKKKKSNESNQTQEQTDKPQKTDKPQETEPKPEELKTQTYEQTDLNKTSADFHPDVHWHKHGKESHSHEHTHLDDDKKKVDHTTLFTDNPDFKDPDVFKDKHIEKSNYHRKRTKAHPHDKDANYSEPKQDLINDYIENMETLLSQKKKSNESNQSNIDELLVKLKDLQSKDKDKETEEEIEEIEKQIRKQITTLADDFIKPKRDTINYLFSEKIMRNYETIFDTLEGEGNNRLNTVASDTYNDVLGNLHRLKQLHDVVSTPENTIELKNQVELIENSFKKLKEEYERNLSA